MEDSFSFKHTDMVVAVVGPLEVNCYILWDRDSRQAVIIDPGGDGSRLVELVGSLDVELTHLINTHGHFDHIGANLDVVEAFSPQSMLHKEDLELFRQSHIQAEYFGLNAKPQPEPRVLVSGNMVVGLGSVSLRLIHTPGHTQGSICIYVEEEGLLFSGDTIFQGSVGRTDLPGGSYKMLMESIKGRILSLDDGVRVFCGHGPPTTIGEERRSNPFLVGV